MRYTSTRPRIFWIALILLMASSQLIAQPSKRNEPSAPQASAADQTQIELEFWKSATQLNTLDAYQAYLETYPNGRFAPLARAATKKLGASAPAPTPTPASPQPAKTVAQPAPPTAAPISGNELLEPANSGSVNLPIGKRIQGLGYIVVGRVAAKKQVVLPEGEWMLLAATDYLVEQAGTGSARWTGRIPFVAVTLAQLEGNSVKSLLSITTNRLAMGVPGYINYLKWADAEGCEQEDGKVYFRGKQGPFMRQLCSYVRSAAHAGPGQMLPATHWKEVQANLGKRGATLGLFNLESTFYVTDPKSSYIRVTRYTCAPPSPDIQGCAALPLKFDKDSDALPPGVEPWIKWAQRYGPLTVTGFTSNLSLKRLDEEEETESTKD